MMLLSSLSNDVLERNNCWRVIKSTMDDDEVLLEPAFKSKDGKVLAINAEVWCKGIAHFKNGLQFSGACMCRADSCDGPLLITIWNGVKDVSIIMPPAPDFVLEQEGPDPFAIEFNLNYEDIFPLHFAVESMFEVEPFVREVILG